MNKSKLACSLLAFLFFFVLPFPVSAETLKQVIEGAKKEGQLRAYTSMQRRTAARIIKEYRKKYPFIKEVDHHRFSGLEEAERVLAEMKVGRIDMDVLLVRSELWKRHRPFLTGPIDWKSLGIAKDRIAKGGFEIIWAGS
ncbi:hypothetical protein, partial [Streptococcus pseudopneumoniae]|uniref:hypothetical protein n=1 Tax=Streptococcus pseudopneumoniae TaxID=257758 RepID=UPI00110C374D